MKVSRGGHTLKTGKIGRVNCIRQQILMPGERMNISMQGSIRLETLRERDVMRINAHLATFMTPLRWLDNDYVPMIKEGPATVKDLNSYTENNLSRLGIGSYTATAGDETFQFWYWAYLRCVNEWYKWPENTDWVFADIGEHGVPAVPLSKTWSRLRTSSTPDATADYTLASAADFDIRDLAEKQARFRSAMKRDVLSFNRWMELVKDTWKGDGSREVDQVPIMLDQTSVGVNPREMPATDGASLGQWQSMFDFNVNHQIKGITAPEHCIISHLLTVRFAATIEGKSPFAAFSFTQMPWEVQFADPEYLASQQPVEVQLGEIGMDNSIVPLGFAPAGWQWRCDHDVIGKSIDIRDSFPYSLVPTNAAECKDATRVKSAFRSQALDDYMVDVFFKEEGHQPIGDSMDSYMSGMVDDSQVKPAHRGQEFPYGGKQL